MVHAGLVNIALVQPRTAELPTLKSDLGRAIGMSDKGLVSLLALCGFP